MRAAIYAVAMIAGLSASRQAHASQPGDLCRVLREFVESVAPDESRAITFRTIWGDKFKDAVDPAFAGKRCEHGGYGPGERVCTYLMEHGSMEFSETTAEEAISCLSKGTHFGPGFELRSGSFTLRYGGDYRGADVDIAFAEDGEVGGMALKVNVEGF